MAGNLNLLVDKLAEELEDKPDKWFNAPRGWLYKPSFTRAQQDRESEGQNDATPRRSSVAYSGFKALVKGSVGTTYNKRWFALNVERRFMVYYKDDQIGSPEGGFIDISRIIDVQISQMADAPQYCIDLVSKEKYFTLAAENQVTMVRWVYAINSCRPQTIPKLLAQPSVSKIMGNTNNVSSERKEKWTRYDHTYQYKGPLMLNVMGTTNKDTKTGKIINNWIIVTSFEPTADGKPGRSEATGVISVKDYLVAVNGIDLMKYTFNESMDIINRAAFPKTVQFLRDNSADRQQSRAEGWAVVFYPALNRRRRRYVDIRWDSINFRKPAPGGSANAQRDAYITLDQIDSIKPIIDKSMPSDQQYILRLICKPDAFIDHVGDDDNSLGTSAAAYVDLCFTKDSQMKNWRSVLVSPTIYSSAETASTIPVQDVEIIESSTIGLTKDINNMAIKSDLTGHFAPREFSITNGELHWSRIGQKMQTTRARGLELANSQGCNLKSVRAVEYSIINRNLTHRFQLLLETEVQTVTIGMKDDISLLRWLDCIKEVVSQAPPLSTNGMYISTQIEKEVTNENEDYDDDIIAGMNSTGMASTGLQSTGTGSDGVGNGFQGYLYKKSNRILSTTRNDYRKRWFVLQDYILAWYKSSSEVEAGVPPQGLIDLRSAYEVRESVDPSAPENSIDIVTNVKIMTMAAVDEADFTLWLDALSDTLEIREMAIQRDGFNGGSKADKAERSLSKEERKAERIAAIRSAIVYSGALMIKSTKEKMFKSPWKDRYFVIASGALTYYAEQSDMFDNDKDCKGEIALANILVVESTNDPKYRAESVFDVHARVLEGGDSNGMRVFTFDAKTVENAEKWMRELCRATEILELKRSSRGVFSSSVSDKMVQARNSRRMAMNANSGNINNPALPPPQKEKIVNILNNQNNRNSQNDQNNQNQSRDQSRDQNQNNDDQNQREGSQRESNQGGSQGQGPLYSQTDVDDEVSSQHTGSNDAPGSGPGTGTGTPTKRGSYEGSTEGASATSVSPTSAGRSQGYGSGNNGNMGGRGGKRGGMGRGVDFRAGSATATFRQSAGSVRIEKNNSNVDLEKEGNDAEQDAGVDYSDAYGDGGI